MREEHLRRAAPANREEDDHEEEFYYTEIDIPLQIFQPTKAVCKKLVLSPPVEEAAEEPGAPAAPLLSDHMDMARPPHENPEYGGQPVNMTATSPTFATIISPGTIQWKPAEQVEQGQGAQPMHAVPIAIPITTFTIATSQQVRPSSSFSPLSPPSPLTLLTLLTPHPPHPFLAVPRQVHPSLPEALQHVPEVPAAAAARRRQEVPEGLRHGAPRALVHAVQVEEGLHEVR